MYIETFRTIFFRDVNRLRNEIEQYQQEITLWQIEGSIANSAGNLCLHLIGNLNTYIGKELGQSGYVRNRDLEFSAKDVSKEELLQKIEATIDVLNRTFDQLTDEQLAQEYPALVFAEKTSIHYMLVHLAAHLSYHLGQINYHRRLLDKQ